MSAHRGRLVFLLFQMCKEEAVNRGLNTMLHVVLFFLNKLREAVSLQSRTTNPHTVLTLKFLNKKK